MAAELDRRKFLKLGLSALAVTTLPFEQVGRLFYKTRAPEKIGITDFENYVVSEINKLPERQVGRITNIQTIKQPYYFGSMVRGLNVNRYFNGGKYWACSFDPDKVKDLDVRQKFVKDLAVQLRIAFRT